MTKESLEKIRFLTPIGIAIFATTLGVIFLPFDERRLETWQKWIIPVLAGAFGALYSALGVRLWHWKRELDQHVGKQIRNAFVSMIPEDIGITPNEKLRLFEKAVWKELTGIFWETIDSDQYLISQKPFFYANGAYYSGAIDCYIIMTFFSLVYLALYFWGFGIVCVVLAAACIATALMGRFFVLPIRRKKHLALSDEQLEVMRQNRLKQIQDKIRQIVREWRDRERLQNNRP